MSFLLCLCLFGLAGSALAREDARFTPAGRTPEGDFDLTVELEVVKTRRLRGRIYLEYRPEGPSIWVELRRGTGPLLFFDDPENSDPPRRRGKRASGMNPGVHLLVARRRHGPEGLASICLELDGRVVDVRYAPVHGPSEAEYGAGAVSGARIVGLSMREVQEAFFEDEFNWDSPEAGSWRTVEGEWGLATTRDAWIAVDRGPFATSSYRASPADGGPALSLVGPKRLGRVYVSVAAKIPEGGEAGIAFGVAPARTVGASGRPDDAARAPADREPGPARAMRSLLVKPGPDGKGSARLLLRTGPSESPLAGPAEAHARPGAWTRIEVWSDWDYVRAAVAGRVVLEADVSDRPAGRVGLVAFGASPVLFDDFTIRPWHVIHERRPGERVQWTTERGNGLSRPGRVPGGLVRPAVPWPLHDFRLEVRVEKGPAFPVPASPEDVDRSDVADVWGRHPNESPEAHGVSLALDVRGPHAVAFVDGRPRFECVLDRLTGGPPGILSPSGARCERIVLEPSRRPLEVELFSNDFSVPRVKLPNGRGVVRVVGHVLRPASGSWRCVKRGEEGVLEGTAEGLGLIRFSRPCPGDVRVEADVHLFPFAQAGLFTAAGRGKARTLGRYSLSVDTTQGTRLVLRRLGAEVAGCPAPDKDPFRIALERRGRHLFGYLAGDLVVQWRDAEPLAGDEVGFFVRKGRVAFGRARITHLRATRSDFRKVNPDWQPLSGKWLLHTGLACIPWDHWITAFGSDEAPAYMGLLCGGGALYERAHFTALRAPDLSGAAEIGGAGRSAEPIIFEPDGGPDVCVVARVSEAGEGFETRTHVHYPLHDISVTLRGDLEAPAHPPQAGGYRFLIAPLPDKDCVLLFRDGQEVAREHGFRIVMGGHNNQPRRFTIVARAVGGIVSCSAFTATGSRVVLEWTDPDPLPAGYVILGAEKGRANFADVTVMDVSER